MRSTRLREGRARLGVSWQGATWNCEFDAWFLIYLVELDQWRPLTRWLDKTTLTNTQRRLFQLESSPKNCKITPKLNQITAKENNEQDASDEHDVAGSACKKRQLKSNTTNWSSSVEEDSYAIATEWERQFVLLTTNMYTFEGSLQDDYTWERHQIARDKNNVEIPRENVNLTLIKRTLDLKKKSGKRKNLV